MKKDIDNFRQDSPHIPSCNATIIAGEKAKRLFREEIVVEGTAEDYNLSFNILLHLPTPQGNNITVLLLNVTRPYSLHVVTQPSTSDSVAIQQSPQQPPSEGNLL